MTFENAHGIRGMVGRWRNIVSAEKLATTCCVHSGASCRGSEQNVAPWRILAARVTACFD